MRMARKIDLLSTAKIKHARPGLHHDGGGLYLQVTTGKDGTNNKSWLFRFKLNGKPRWMGLGSIHTIGLGDARDAADAARKLVLAGKDPVAERNVERARREPAPESMTFERCAVLYMAAHEKGWKSAVHRRQWTQSLRDHVYPTLGSMPVDLIDLNAVLAVLTPLWTAKPETASRVRSRIELVLDWARVREYRSGENPARWRGHLKHLLPSTAKVKAVRHHSAMPYEALPTFLVELRKVKSTAAMALEFCILTAARTGEVIGANWEEIDISAGAWAIPGARMKGGKPHKVPLSRRAIDILDGMRGLDRVMVFPGFDGKPMDTQAMWRVAQALGADVTIHGFRSTFKDWCAECTNSPDWLSEKALAHVVGDETRRAYQRGDMFNRRRKLMEDWSAFCASPVAGANVVPLHAGR
jgi:integrase